MKSLYLCLFSFFCFCSATFSQVNLLNGLVAYYPLNGDANDHSGNGNNPIFNNATPIAGQSGQPNTAYYFNGAGSYIQIPDAPSLNTGNQITVYALVKPEGFYYGNCHGNSILQRGADYQPGAYNLRFDDALYSANTNCNGGLPDTTHENLDVYYGTSVTPYSPFIEKNNWYSIIYTADPDSIRLYINCVLIITVAAEPGISYTGSGDLFLGQENNPAYPYWFNGVIDEVRIYNRKLNTQEINTLSGCPVSPCAPNFTDFDLTQSNCNGESVQFNAVFPTSIQTAKWSLGDGSTAATNSVNHTYAGPGNYPVKLVVQYTSGCVDSVVKIIPFLAPTPDPTVISTNDTTVCTGQQLTLQALANKPVYCWTPAASLSDPSVAGPTATPSGSTVYFCTTTQAGTNLIYNGDFSKGDTAFASDYYAVNPDNSGAEYNIGVTPSSWSNGLGNCTDHTSGSGNMMMVSGLGGFAKVWSQKVVIQPNTNYLFSTWIQSLSASNPAVLNFSINGAILSTSINAASSACGWSQFSTVWNSGDSTNAVLSLVSQGNINGSFFALDDISFAGYSTTYDSVKVTLATYPILTARADTTICGAYNVPLSATGAIGYSWSPGTGLSDSTIANPVAPTGATTNYVVTAFDYPACSSTDTVKVTVLPLPVFALTPSGSDICQGTSFTLAAQGGNTYQWSSVAQGQGLSSDSVYSASGVITDTFSVAIYNSTCLLNDTLRSVVTVDTIPILSLAKSNDINCSDGNATLTVSGGNNYTWTPAATLRNANTAAPIATPSVTTWYTVSVTNGACSTQDSIQLLVDYGGEASKFAMPDAFTPNGDGINDCFKVQYWGVVKSFELSVFNRWGVRVFYTQNPSDCWDGTFHGIQQPSGAYVYQIKASSPCAGSGYVFRKGTLTLIR